MISNNKELIQNLVPWITIDVYNDKDVSLSELSYGQKFIIRFLYSLLNQLRNLNSHPEYQDILLLLDEVENGLHPQWQKEFIKLLTDVLSAFLEKYPKRFSFNIVLTSHSPFIISDLPKENVIFLKDGKNISESTNINPFGANIHTLLSHGFFMEGGLMGESAKDKINDVIKVLGSKRRVSKKNQKYCKYLISLIGEPFLKEKLLKMYDDKFQVIKEERIKQLEEELRK